jgi:hypothetical protein
VGVIRPFAFYWGTKLSRKTTLIRERPLCGLDPTPAFLQKGSQPCIKWGRILRLLSGEKLEVCSNGQLFYFYSSSLVWLFLQPKEKKDA